MSKSGEFRCAQCDTLLIAWSGTLTSTVSEIRVTCPKCGEERILPTMIERPAPAVQKPTLGIAGGMLQFPPMKPRRDP
jgi:phage FluMu protein Com